MNEIDSHLKHPYNEVCASCGHRRGEHYSNKCSRPGKVPYEGTYFVPTNLFAMEKYVAHWGLVHGKSDPNQAFLTKKRG